MFLKNGPEVECNNCKEVFIIDAEDFSEMDSQRDERGMGAEIGYFWEYEGQCDNCNERISVNLDAWEYPMGAFNASNDECEGCIVVTEAEYEVTTVEDDYEDENY